jgi:hypothetical protein
LTKPNNPEKVDNQKKSSPVLANSVMAGSVPTISNRMSLSSASIMIHGPESDEKMAKRAGTEAHSFEQLESRPAKKQRLCG